MMDIAAIQAPAMKLKGLRMIVSAEGSKIPKVMATERAVRALKEKDLVLVYSGSMVCEFADHVHDSYSLIGVHNSGEVIRVRASRQHLVPCRDGSVTPTAGYVEINPFNPSKPDGMHYLEWLREGRFILNG